jgi:hypothetical protein
VVESTGRVPILRRSKGRLARAGGGGRGGSSGDSLAKTTSGRLAESPPGGWLPEHAPTDGGGGWLAKAPTRRGGLPEAGGSGIGRRRAESSRGRRRRPSPKRPSTKPTGHTGVGAECSSCLGGLPKGVGRRSSTPERVTSSTYVVSVMRGRDRAE